MTRLRVLLADDHPVVRNGLRTLFAVQPDMEVVGEACDGEQVLREVLLLRPDVVVMDISMPGLGGAEATEQICGQAPGVRVVALTAHEDRCYLRLALRAGASGYVLKRAAAEELVRAVRAVAAGQTYIDPAVAGQLVDNLKHGMASPPQIDLSEREAEVLKLIALGNPLKKIAAKLNVAVRTVETYKARALEKLHLTTRAELVRYAVQQGWLADG